jgi:hypothetical protein
VRAHPLCAPSIVSSRLHECSRSSMHIKLFKVCLSWTAISNRVLFDLNLLSWCQERVKSTGEVVLCLKTVNHWLLCSLPSNFWSRGRRLEVIDWWEELWSVQLDVWPALMHTSCQGMVCVMIIFYLFWIEYSVLRLQKREVPLLFHGRILRFKRECLIKVV